MRTVLPSIAAQPACRHIGVAPKVTSDSRQQFAEEVRAEPVDLGRACLLIGAEVEPELKIVPYLGVLDDLAVQAAADAAAAAHGPAEQAAALRRALGEQAGFRGTGTDYLELNSSLLHDVLRRRRGLPILLSIVWLEVARRLDIPAYGIATPGQFVIGVGDPNGEHVYADPYDGGRVLTQEELADVIRDTAAMELTPDHLAPATGADIVLRVLTNIRAFAARTGSLRTRLWAVELSLLVPHHPVDLRRERAHLLGQLGDYLSAAVELDAYAQAVESVDDDAADAARKSGQMLRARLN